MSKQPIDQRRNKCGKYLETNGNKSTTRQNLWDTVKVVLRGKFIALKAYIKKTRKISNQQVNFTLREPGEEQTTQS